MRRLILPAVCFTLLLATMISIASAETIVLKSGNAAYGQLDPLITVRGAEVTIAGSYAYAAAQPYQQALVVGRLDVSWCNPPAGSEWIGVTTNWACPRGGYQYDMSFDMPAAFSNASLSLSITSDNFFAFYLNGNLIGAKAELGIFKSLYAYQSTDQSFWVPGANHIRIDAINRIDDVDTPTGIAFLSQIEYSPVPEPSSILVLVCGMGGLGVVLQMKNQWGHRCKTVMTGTEDDKG